MRLIGDRKDPPRSRNSLEVVFAAIGQRVTRADAEVADGAADEYLVRSGKATHTRADVDGEPADVVIGEELAFAGVQAGPDLKAEVADRVADRSGAADRAAWTVEEGERTVAERLNEAPAIAFDLSAHDAIVALEQRSPGGVAQLRGTLGRTDYVGELNRGKDAVADGRSPYLLPRRSNRITRANDESRPNRRAKLGSSQNNSMFDRYGGTTTTSSGPSPTTW